jgi:hypothetical protein
MKENLGKAKVQLDWVVRSRKKSPKTQSIQRWFCIGKALPKLPIVGIETFLSLIVLPESVFKKCLKGYYIGRAITLRGQP